MELKNKRVLVVGLGKSALSAAMFLRGLGALVTVSDTRSAVALAREIPTLLDAGIMVESGGHGLLTSNLTQEQLPEVRFQMAQRVRVHLPRLGTPVRLLL